MRVNPRQRKVKSVYKVHIDVVHFRKSDKKRLHESDPDSGVRFTQERINKLTELSQMPDIYERLSKALGELILSSISSLVCFFFFCFCFNLFLACFFQLQVFMKMTT